MDKTKIFNAIVMGGCGIQILVGIKNKDILLIVLGLGLANVLFLSMIYLEIKK